MMKMRNFHGSKKGVASLYAVIFATILFGVITLSFMRIILSEARQSGDDELSQSAYDSALAGVEDAKRAVNAYYACLNSGGTSCVKPFDESCAQFAGTSSKLKSALQYSQVEGEVKIQETSQNAVSKKDKDKDTTAVDQAYTCVTMSDVVEDYRSTLTSDTRVRVIPLGVESEKLKQAKVVEFQWFSENNSTKLDKLYNDQALRKKGDTSNVPVLSLTLLYTGSTFQISEFNNSRSPNYDTMILLPGEANNAKARGSIAWAEIQNAGDSDSRNEPFLIKCQQGEFACSVDLMVDNHLGLPDKGNALLIVSMPYGENISDFKVAMYADEEKQKPILFEGAQISVDSTGRANQLYRRVETRLDPVDSYFPYPQFAAELDGDDDSKLWKNFWITYNCWTQGGYCDNNGTLSD